MRALQVITAVLVCVFVAAFLTPVHVVLEHDTRVLPTLHDGAGVVRPVSVPIPDVSSVTVRNVSTDGSVVELALPVPFGRTRISVDELDAMSGFEENESGDRVSSRTPGASLRFTASTDRLEVPFVGFPDGGRALVEVGGSKLLVDLARDPSQFVPISVPSRRTRSTRSYFVANAPSEIRIEAVSGSGRIVASVFVGARRIVAESVFGEGSRLLVLPPWYRLVATALSSFRLVFAPLLLLLGILIVSCSVGSLVLRRNDIETASGRRRILDASVGISTIALVTNSLAYVFASDASALAVRVVLGALVASAMGLGIRARGRDLASSPSIADQVPVVVWIATIVGMFATFWPTHLGGPGAIGLLQTDSFYYTTVSEALGERSITSLGSDVGFNMRSIDLALVAQIVSVSGQTANDAWIAFCMVLALLVPPASYFVVRDWLKDDFAALVTSVVMAVTPSFAGLFHESYLAQYVGCATSVFALLATSSAYERISERKDWAWPDIVPIAVTSGFSLLVYPFFAVPALCCLASIALWTKRDLRERIRLISVTSGLLVAVVNVGGTFIVGAGDVSSYVGPLNEIAEHVVFPFYRRPRFVAILMGLAPFHSERSLIRDLAKEFGSDSVLWAFSDYLRFVFRKRVFVVVGAIAVAFVLNFIRHRRRILSTVVGPVVLISFVGYLGLAVVAWFTSGLYATCKLLWTTAAFLPLVVVPIVALGARSGEIRPLRIGSRIVLSALLVGSLISRLAGAAYWLGEPAGVVSSLTHTVAASDLIAVRDFARGVGVGSRDFAFIGASGADRSELEFVMSAQAYAILETSGWNALNTKSSPSLADFRSFDDAYGRRSGARWLIAIDSDAVTFPEGYVLKRRGRLFAVAERSDSNDGR